MGTVLRGYDERPVGLIVVLGRKPLRNPRLAESLLRMAAVRTAGELERRHAEEKLRGTMNKLRLALEAGHLGTWSYDFASRRLVWDEACRAMFGVASGDTIGYPKLLELIHENDRERVDRTVKEALRPESGGAYEAECRVVKPDGTFRWVTAMGQAYFEGEGKDRQAVRFFGTVQDATSRKQAEHALRESEEEFRLVFEHSNDAIFWFDGGS